jgi:hypothetical protein
MTDAAPAPLLLLGAPDAVSCEGDFCEIEAGPIRVSAAVAAHSDEE